MRHAIGNRGVPKVRNHSSGPFAKPGFLFEIMDWAQKEIAPLGLTLTGRFRQLNASPTFSLIRFETDGPALWFKAVGEPNLREFSITRNLSQMFPTFLPRLIATQTHWSAWLTTETQGKHPEEGTEIGVWKAVVQTLADLQIASFGKTFRCLDAGCTDVRICTLLQLADPFLEVMTELMGLQTKNPPAPLSRNELLALGVPLKDALGDSQNCEIPNALNHLDFNPGNIIVSEHSPHILGLGRSWCRTSLPHIPIPRGASAPASPAQRNVEEELLTTYTRNWRSFAAPTEIADAVARAPCAGGLCMRCCRNGLARPRPTNSAEHGQTSSQLDAAHAVRSESLGSSSRPSECPMPKISEPLPSSLLESVIDTVHGIPIVDPYRWLEDQNSARTREWLEAQNRYARSHLGAVCGRDKIRSRIREFLSVETYDSVQKAGERYFFRKRLPEQEQPCIYMRDGSNGEDQLLLNPVDRGTGCFTALKPLCASPDGRLLLYEIKQGGERTGTFELLDISTRRILPDTLSHGYLRGFAFSPDSKSFYYVHEAAAACRPFYRAVRHHVLGTNFDEDLEIFYAGEQENLRLALVSKARRPRLPGVQIP